MKLAKDPYWLKSGMYTVLSRFANLVFGFGSFLLLVRIIDKKSFGIWALFLTATSIIEVARNGLVQNAQIKYASAADEIEYPKILNASLTLNILITMTSVIVMCGLAHVLSLVWKSPEIEGMFYLYTFTTIILIAFSQFNFIQQAKFDFKGIFYSNAIRQGFFFIAVLYFFLTRKAPSLIELVVYQTIAAVLGAISGWVFVKKYFRITFALEWEWVKKLFHYGKFVFGTSISSMIYQSIDQMILGGMLTTAEVGAYNAASRTTNFIDVPVSAVSAIVFPQSAKRAAEQGNEALVYLYERSVGLLIALILPMVLVCVFLAKWVILVIAGAKYFDAIPVMQVIMVSSLLQPYARQFGVVMDSAGMPKINFYLLLIVTIFNIAAIYFGIKVFGVVGAALGSAVAMTIFVTIALRILKKKFGIKFLHTFVYCWKFYSDGFKLVLGKIGLK
jgi:O-antigen/teichoic acid export membrane protein